MRHVYIDCGAHKGKTIKAFVHSKEYSQHDFEIYAFEPNPYAKVHKKTGIKVIQAAIWTEDGQMEFYIPKKRIGGQGGTLLKEKSSGDLDKNNPILVASINFGKWIRETFSPDDYLVVKMDVEGAEYAVLESMFVDGSIRYIDKLYLETHWQRVGVPEEKNRELMDRLDDLPTLKLKNEYLH